MVLSTVIKDFTRRELLDEIVDTSRRVPVHNMQHKRTLLQVHMEHHYSIQISELSNGEIKAVLSDSTCEA